MFKTFSKRPTPWQAIKHIAVKLHNPQPVAGQAAPVRSLSDIYTSSLQSIVLGCHIAQRTARLVGVALLRTVVKHPLGWPLNQELLCMLMFGILQSRQVPVWRSFFEAVGDLQNWVPVEKQQVQTGSCNSWWVRLPPEARPQQPKATINWVFFHGGAFVAGHALMYLGSYAYWLHKLAQQGIHCSILSVEYPLAPEHPFPCAVEAAAGVIEWLLQESGEAVPYLVGGDSAGGNLALAALALLREQGKLSILPLALTLLSPAVDMSDSSVFGRGPDKVSNHIDSDGFASGDGPSSDPADAACRDGRAQAADSSPAVQESCSTSAADGQAAGAAATAGNRIGAANEASHSSKVLQGRAASHSMDGREYEAATAATIRSSGFADVSTANAMLQDALQQAKQQLQRHRMQQQLHQHPDITAAGFSSPCQLLRGLVSEVYEGFRAHGSRRGTQAAAADGYFDYLPRSSIADDLHHYLHDSSLLTNPLVSPTYLDNFSGLCQHGMIIVAGGVELMRPDIAAFAAKVSAAGVPVKYHEGPGQPHSYMVLGLPHLLKEGRVLIDYVAEVACR